MVYLGQPTQHYLRADVERSYRRLEAAFRQVQADVAAFKATLAAAVKESPAPDSAITKLSSALTDVKTAFGTVLFVSPVGRLLDFIRLHRPQRRAAVTGMGGLDAEEPPFDGGQHECH